MLKLIEYFSADDKLAFFADMAITQVHIALFIGRENTRAYTHTYIYMCVVYSSYVRIIDTWSISRYTYFNQAP